MKAADRLVIHPILLHPDYFFNHICGTGILPSPIDCVCRGPNVAVGTDYNILVLPVIGGVFKIAT